MPTLSTTLLVFGFLAAVSAAFVDTTCDITRKSTESGIMECNYAKSINLGTFNCLATVLYFNPNGSFNRAEPFPYGFRSFYNETKGSLSTNYLDGSPVADEYCAEDGEACIVEYGPEFTGLFIKRTDLYKGERGSTSSVVHGYSKDMKQLVKLQTLIPRKDKGEAIVTTLYGPDGNVQLIVNSKCDRAPRS